MPKGRGFSRRWVDHFIGDDPIAKKANPEEFSFLQGHVVHGVIEAYGEDPDDHWFLIVENNKVRTEVVPAYRPKTAELDKTLVAQLGG